MRKRDQAYYDQNQSDDVKRPILDVIGPFVFYFVLIGATVIPNLSLVLRNGWWTSPDRDGCQYVQKQNYVIYTNCTPTWSSNLPIVSPLHL